MSELSLHSRMVRHGESQSLILVYVIRDTIQIFNDYPEYWQTGLLLS
jgi:hypothetical protein